MKAFIFPGQGSQYVGMGYNLYKKNQKAKKIFNLANKLLDFDLCKIMFEGTEEQLRQTEIAQLAVFVHSIAILSICSENPDVVAGHSLGEYTALVACKAAEFEEILFLIQDRANAMKEASKLNPGKMAAIIGLDQNNIQEICNEINQRDKKIIYIANINSLYQIVVSGTPEGIDLALDLFKNNNAKLIIELKVSGAFHTPLMQYAQDDLKIKIQNIMLSKPKFPIYQNVNACPTKDIYEIKNNLTAQIISPVLWNQTIEKMISDGIFHFEEIGPGKVLKNIVNRINRDVDTYALDQIF